MTTSVGTEPLQLQIDSIVFVAPQLEVLEVDDKVLPYITALRLPDSYVT